MAIVATEKTKSAERRAKSEDAIYSPIFSHHHCRAEWQSGSEKKGGRSGFPLPRLQTKLCSSNSLILPFHILFNAFLNGLLTPNCSVSFFAGRRVTDLLVCLPVLEHEPE